MPAKRHCLHCGKFRWVMARGLCKPCRMNPAVYPKYPVLNESHETDADVDALVAERMKRLPKWWTDGEARKLSERPQCGPVAPLVLAMVRRRRQGFR